jgi:hypothetical protein
MEPHRYCIDDLLPATNSKEFLKLDRTPSLLAASQSSATAERPGGAPKPC